MNSFTVNYDVYFRLKDNHNYQFTKDGVLFNSKTGRKIKKVSTKSGCIGYNIKGKFRSLKYLRPKLEKIPKQVCPF